MADDPETLKRTIGQAVVIDVNIQSLQSALRWLVDQHEANRSALASADEERRALLSRLDTLEKSTRETAGQQAGQIAYLSEQLQAAQRKLDDVGASAAKLAAAHEESISAHTTLKTVATGHTDALAELNKANADKEARLSAAELALRTAASAEEARSVEVDGQLQRAAESSTEAVRQLRSELAETQTALERTQRLEADGRVERERLQAVADAAGAHAARLEEGQRQQMAAVEARLRGLSAAMTQELGVEEQALAVCTAVATQQVQQELPQPPPQYQQPPPPQYQQPPPPQYQQSPPPQYQQAPPHPQQQTQTQTPLALAPPQQVHPPLPPTPQQQPSGQLPTQQLPTQSLPMQQLPPQQSPPLAPTVPPMQVATPAAAAGLDGGASPMHGCGCGLGSNGNAGSAGGTMASGTTAIGCGSSGCTLGSGVSGGLGSSCSHGSGPGGGLGCNGVCGRGGGGSGGGGGGSSSMASSSSMGGGVSAGSGVGGGSGNVRWQLLGALERLDKLSREAEHLRVRCAALESAHGSGFLGLEARLKQALWNEEAQTARLAQLEATMAGLAPASAVPQLELQSEQLAGALERLGALEEGTRRLDAEGRARLHEATEQQGHELLRSTEARAAQLEAAAHSVTEALTDRVDSVADVAETARLASEAALRAIAADGERWREELRGQVSTLLSEIDASRTTAVQMSLDELRAGRTALRDEMRALRSESRTATAELRHKLAACWEGLRESRVELGDVMQTLHHLVERSELQHVINQMVARAAYANPQVWGGGAPGAPKRPLASPRVGLAESVPSHAASQQPPPLPQALQHNHRRCLKKGECSCAERLAVTLGAGDPRLALDKLFARQLQLLLSVRRLWQRSEATRGALPTVPQLPPLPQPVRPDLAAGSQSVRWADHNHNHQPLQPSPPERPREGGLLPQVRRPSSRECAPASADEDEGQQSGALFEGFVGAYLDGGVLSGYDEQGALGPVSSGANALPERLADL